MVSPKLAIISWSSFGTFSSRVSFLCVMPWDTWKKPAAGEKVNYWKRPNLDSINELSRLDFFATFQTTNSPSSWDMTDHWKGSSWGNGPATSSQTNSNWNSASGGASGWEDNTGDTANNELNGGSSARFDQPDDPAEISSHAVAGRGCFNCGEGWCTFNVQADILTISQKATLKLSAQSHVSSLVPAEPATKKGACDVHSCLMLSC